MCGSCSKNTIYEAEEQQYHFGSHESEDMFGRLEDEIDDIGRHIGLFDGGLQTAGNVLLGILSVNMPIIIPAFVGYQMLFQKRKRARKCLLEFGLSFAATKYVAGTAPASSDFASTLGL